MFINLDKNKGHKRPLNRNVAKKGQLLSCKTRADAKERCTYELVSAKTNGNVCVASIRITNAGQTQIGNGLSTLYLSEESGSGTPIAVKRLAPGESREVLIAFVWNGLDSASFGLEQKDQYRLSELGINPITITRPDSK